VSCVLAAMSPLTLGLILDYVIADIVERLRHGLAAVCSTLLFDLGANPPLNVSRPFFVQLPVREGDEEGLAEKTPTDRPPRRVGFTAIGA